MVGTEFLKGQGLGNQLFCYVSARCIAADLGYEFGTAGQEQLAVNIHSKKGMYFMDMDLGIPVSDGTGQSDKEDSSRQYRNPDRGDNPGTESRLGNEEDADPAKRNNSGNGAGPDRRIDSEKAGNPDKEGNLGKKENPSQKDKGKWAAQKGYRKDNLKKYHEKEERLYLKTCVHDMTHGCYVAGADEDIYKIEDNTLLYGNLQAERYFISHREEIREWLKVKKEYDSYEYTRDNLCIINIRGGEYVDNHQLFLRRKYWLDAMENMRKFRADMEFMVVTDDVSAAKRVLPEVEAHHFGLAGDYVTLKNARYLILSNSSFAFFPAFTSETVQKAIAPKYWARHNVSDGYWASEQNIYEGLSYQDRKGRLFSAEECREELEMYKVKCKGAGRENVPFAGREVGRQEKIDRLWYWTDKAVSKVIRSFGKNGK